MSDELPWDEGRDEARRVLACRGPVAATIRVRTIRVRMRIYQGLGPQKIKKTIGYVKL